MKKTTLGDRIRHIREGLLKANQADFARSLGFSRLATISDYETDKRSPDIATLRRIAVTGGVTLDWLLTGDGPSSMLEAAKPGLAKDSPNLYGGGFAEVRVYDQATAGPPGEFPASEPVDSIMVPRADCEKGAVAILVRGNGMSPSILDGAIVGIDTGSTRVVSGEIYAVWMDFEGVTLKRVFVSPDRVVLKPDNPAFPETAVLKAREREKFIIGKVAWAHQRY